MALMSSGFRHDCREVVVHDDVVQDGESCLLVCGIVGMYLHEAFLPFGQDIFLTYSHFLFDDDHLVGHIVDQREICSAIPFDILAFGLPAFAFFKCEISRKKIVIRVSFRF